MERLNYVTLSSTRAKHRAARRPISQVIVDAAGDNLSTAGKRTVAVAATSGLLVSMLGTSASAATDTNVSIGTADVSALTSQARAQLQAAPAVTVADASWSVSAGTVKPVKVKPAPEARQVVSETPRANESASRSQTRTAAADAETQSAPKSAEKTAPPAAASGSAVIEIASRYVGVPYVYGGTTPNGFDCSGFTSYVYAQLGIDLPRSSGAQRGMGTVIPRSQAKPGDLIWSPGHVAIYAGGNTQIDAPRPGKSVQFRSIWQSNPTFIRLG